MKTQAEHYYSALLLNGASPGQALIAGLRGAVLGGLTAGISNKIGNLSSTLARAISHGVVSGVRAIIQGGSFLSGFLSSFASTYLQPIGRALAKGSYYGRAFFSAMVGGTVSVIGGGKFANGAVTSAFQFMFNDWLHEENAFIKNAKSFLKGVKSLPKGLYDFGDYMAKISGFRDSQNGSVVLENYEQEKAIYQTKQSYKLIHYIATHPKARALFVDAVAKYAKIDPAYTIGRGLTGFSISKLSRVPLVIPSLSGAGTVLSMPARIDMFARGVVYGY